MSKSVAKNVEIFLPDGDHRGTKIAGINNRTINVVYIPRSFLEYLKPVVQSKIDKVGVYLLIGQQINENGCEIYIGESENCLSRIINHDIGKDFWSGAIIITSKSDAITKGHAKYLEWMLCDYAQRIGRCKLLNVSLPNMPHVTEAMEAELHDIFETVVCLISVLGFPILDHEIQTDKIKDESSTRLWESPVAPGRENKEKSQTRAEAVFHIESILRSSKYASCFRYEDMGRKEKRRYIISHCLPWENSEQFRPRLLTEDDITRLTLELQKDGCQKATFSSVGRCVRMIAGENKFKPEILPSWAPEDEWTDTVLNCVSDLKEVTIKEILENALTGINQHDDVVARRVGKILRSNGWEKKQKWFNGQNRKIWINPTKSLKSIESK